MNSKLKAITIIFLIFGFSQNVLGWQNLRASRFKVPYKIKYPEKYKDQLDSNNTLIAAQYHVTIEKTPDGKYIRKQFFPSTKQITSLETYSDIKLSKREGLSKRWTFDGKLISSGMYSNNLTTDEWKIYSQKNGISYLYTKGIFKKGKKEGEWPQFDENNKLVKSIHYQNGNMIRPQFTPKTMEEMKEANERWEREEKKLDSLSTLPHYKVDDIPYFPLCKDVSEDKATCSIMKMQDFIYENLQYPELAEREGIEGNTVVSFEISKEGKTKFLEIRNPVCEEFRLECIRLIELMPNWVPGKRKGKKVNVIQSFPINFIIEGSPTSKKISRKLRRFDNQ